MSQDRIEKVIFLKATPARVWRALASAREFGAWFGANLDGAVFAPGARVQGPITTPGYEQYTFVATIERMEPERYLSYRWPHTKPGEDPAGKPTTQVEFHLEPVEGGTRLTVVESGFEAIPADRRAEILRGNEEGWALQAKSIERHVAG